MTKYLHIQDAVSWAIYWVRASYHNEYTSEHTALADDMQVIAEIIMGQELDIWNPKSRVLLTCS